MPTRNYDVFIIKASQNIALVDQNVVNNVVKPRFYDYLPFCICFDLFMKLVAIEIDFLN